MSGAGGGGGTDPSSRNKPYGSNGDIIPFGSPWFRNWHTTQFRPVRHKKHAPGERGALEKVSFLLRGKQSLMSEAFLSERDTRNYPRHFAET